MESNGAVDTVDAVGIAVGEDETVGDDDGVQVGSSVGDAVGCLDVGKVVGDGFVGVAVAGREVGAVVGAVVHILMYR